MRALFALAVLAIAGCADPAVSCKLSDSVHGCDCTAAPNATVDLALCEGSAVRFCCADPSYPSAAGSGCGCRDYGCTVGDFQCACAIGTVAATMPSACPSRFTRCCDDGTNCICDSATDACPGTQTKVAACGAAVHACGGGRSLVSTCGSPYDK